MRSKRIISPNVSVVVLSIFNRLKTAYYLVVSFILLLSLSHSLSLSLSLSHTLTANNLPINMRALCARKYTAFPAFMQERPCFVLKH